MFENISNFNELLEQAKNIYWEKPFTELRERSITYQQAYDEVICISKLIKKYGKKNYFLLVDTSYEWCVLLFAIKKAGNPCLIASPDHLAQIIEKEYANMDSIFIIEQNKKEKVCNEETLVLKDAIRILNSCYYVFEGKTNHKNKTIEKDEIVIFTSGSGGRNKGVILSEKGMINNAYSLSKQVHFEDSLFVSIPFFHAYGLTVGLILTLLLGHKIVFSNGDNSLKNINDSKCKSILGVPLVANFLLTQYRQGHKCDYLKQLLCGGAKLEDALCEELSQDGFDVVLGYGCTECGTVIAADHYANMSKGYTGKLLDCFEYKQSTMDSCGEIMVRGNSVMRDYLDEHYTFIEGYYSTGDIGCIDNGYVKIVGREKNVLVRFSGEKVIPEILEGKIKNRLSVDDAIVFLEKMQNGDYLCLTLEMSQLNKRSLTMEEVLNAVEETNDTNPSYLRIERTYVDNNGFSRCELSKVMREKTISNNDENVPLDILGKISKYTEVDVSEIKRDKILNADLGIDSISLYCLLIDLKVDTQRINLEKIVYVKDLM